MFFKQHPFVHKSQNIQLFEGDFNIVLKYLLVRQLVTTDRIDITAFGSIHGRDSKEAIKLLDMVYTNHRLFPCILITMCNDIAGYYDQI